MTNQATMRVRVGTGVSLVPELAKQTAEQRRRKAVRQRQIRSSGSISVLAKSLAQYRK